MNVKWRKIKLRVKFIEKYKTAKVKIAKNIKKEIIKIKEETIIKIRKIRETLKWSGKWNPQRKIRRIDIDWVCWARWLYIDWEVLCGF